MDYKGIIRQKATVLRSLIDASRDQLPEDTKFQYANLINSAFEITNGRLDALDYDVRENAITNYSTQLDNAISSFQPKKQGENGRTF